MSDIVRTADLNVWLDGAEIKVSCQINKGWRSAGSVRLNIDRSALAAKISTIKEILPPTETKVWAGLEDPLAAPPPGVIEDEFKRCMEWTVSAGSALYAELAGNGLKTILEKLNGLPEGSQLTINTDCAFFPWEILYPSDYSKDWPHVLKDANPPQPKQLWGYRFIINYNLLPAGDEGWEPPIEQHENGPAFISLNLNPTIDDAFKSRKFKPIEFHQQFYDNRLVTGGGEIWKSGTDILTRLLAQDNQATVIYLYCHGSSSVPFSTGIVEQLEFDGTTRINPSSLNYNNTYARGPIVILNSCSSASQSPLSFSSFHSAFRKKGAMGIIGTTIQIPATFAAAFGKNIIDSYLNHVPIGVAIYKLRRELVEKNNPLALFYSLQCPAYITAPDAGKVNS